LLRCLTNSAAAVALGWNGNGSRLAVSTADGRVAVWHSGNGKRTAYISRVAGAGLSRTLALAPQENLLVTAYEDRHVRLWEFEPTRLVGVAPADSHRIFFSPDGARFGPIFRSDGMSWLEQSSAPEFRSFGIGHSNDQLESCKFGADNRLLLAGSRTNVVFCDVENGPLMRTFQGRHISAVALDPQDKMLVAGGQGGLVRWSARWIDEAQFERADAQLIHANGGWRVLAFSPGGNWFAAADVNSNTACVFDRTLTNCVAQLGPHDGLDALAISPGARWVATGSSADRHVRVWDVKSGDEIFSSPVGAKPGAAFSADGKWLAIFGETIELRETGSWRAAPPLPFAADPPVTGAAAFSSDSRLLAVVCDGSNVQLFDMAKFEPLGLLQPPSPLQLNSITFSPDGARLVAACHRAQVRVWDLRRIRERLAEFHLDWELPPLPPLAHSEPARLRLTFR
jgi:WD40 repeat protein